jgi:hypothetical protein
LTIGTLVSYYGYAAACSLSADGLATGWINRSRRYSAGKLVSAFLLFVVLGVWVVTSDEVLRRSPIGHALAAQYMTWYTPFLVVVVAIAVTTIVCRPQTTTS